MPRPVSTPRHSTPVLLLLTPSLSPHCFIFIFYFFVYFSLVATDSDLLFPFPREMHLVIALSSFYLGGILSDSRRRGGEDVLTSGHSSRLIIAALMTGSPPPPPPNTPPPPLSLPPAPCISRHWSTLLVLRLRGFFVYGVGSARVQSYRGLWCVFFPDLRVHLATIKGCCEGGNFIYSGIFVPHVRPYRSSLFSFYSLSLS